MKRSQIVAFALSALVLFGAARLCVPLKSTLAAEQNGWASYTGRVVEVLDSKTEFYDINDNLKRTTILFSVKLKSGKLKGETVPAVQVIDDFIALKTEAVRNGDRAIILQMQDEIPPLGAGLEELAENPAFVFEEYHRLGAIGVLALLFALLIILFGGTKGVTTLASLLLTCLAVFRVFIPAIFTGYSVYACAITICLYIIVMTVLVVNGLDKKSVAAISGCFCGILVSALLSVCMAKILKLNGFLNNDSLYLAALLPGGQGDLLAVLFSAIVIGAVGAVMDVAMSLASALYELALSVPDITFKKLVKSGFAIGRDMMGTMANTLILAYIGSSLSFVLILIAYNSSFLALLNHQMIIVEMLQSLAGSIGILCGIPLTTVIAAALYSVKIVVTVGELKD